MYNMYQWLSWKTLMLAFAVFAACLIAFSLWDHGDPKAISQAPPTHNCGHAHQPAGGVGAKKQTIDTGKLQAAHQQAKAFTDWARGWSQQKRTNKANEMVAEGLKLAGMRRAAMELLIQHDPDAALEHALGYAEYAALPEALRLLVEQPFSNTQQIELLINCMDENGSQMRYLLQDAQGQQRTLFMPEQHRVPLTKRNLPVQGIQLDGMAVVRAQVFQVVEGADAAFVTAQWPSAQRDPNLCFSTGEPIQGTGLTAVAGGWVFHFQDQEQLSIVEAALQQADALPGIDTGSSWLIKTVAASGLDAFPIAQFTAESEAAAYASTTGAKTALFILIDFSDKPGQPVNPATLEQVIDLNVNDGLARYSYNQTSMNATVTSTTYRVANASTTYGSYDALYTHALNAYKASNPDPLPLYDTVGIYFTSIGYTWVGLASVGGQKMWLHNTTNSESILHEFGHNYGLSHANYWVFNNSNPASTNPVDPTGTNEEYGDIFDNMGDGNVADGHFNPAAKAFLNWIPSTDWGDLVNSSNNGTYRVYRFDHASSTGRRGLRIAKSATADYYWVGYRNNYANLDSFTNGAYLVWESGNSSNNQSWLLDTTPGSTAGKADAPITLGRTYSDTASNVHITAVAVGGTSPNQYLDVTVNFGPFPGNAAPTGSLIGPTAVNAREKVLFNVEASDSNGDTLAYAWNMGDGVVKTNSSSITHSWIQGGSYNVSVTVSDMKGGTVTLQQTVTVTDPLTTWTARTSGTTNDLYGIAANSTHVVAVGTKKILRSTDGNSWSNVTPGSGFTNVYLYDVCWTGSEFLACGMDYDFGISAWEGVVFKSTDGQTWTRIYETNLADTTLHSITSNGSGAVVAVGDNATIRHRTAGGAWSSIAPGVNSSHVLQDVAYGEGYFVFVGHATTPSYNGDVAIWRSSDGLTWSNLSAGSGLDNWMDYRTIHHTGDHFVANGFYSKVCYSLNQAQSWQTNQVGDIHSIEAFASGAGLTYAVGINFSNADADLVSADGMSWTPINPGDLSDRNGLAFFNNTFISVGDGGSIRQSAAVSASDTYASFAETYFPGGGVNALPSANPDGDWADNLTEYALDGNPTLPGSAPPKPVFSLNGSGIPTIDISRSSRRGDVAYSVWWSTNLSTWTRSGLTTETDNSTLLKVKADGQNLSGGRGFLRLDLDQ